MCVVRWWSLVSDSCSLETSPNDKCFFKLEQILWLSLWIFFLLPTIFATFNHRFSAHFLHRTLRYAKIFELCKQFRLLLAFLVRALSTFTSNFDFYERISNISLLVSCRKTCFSDWVLIQNQRQNQSLLLGIISNFALLPPTLVYYRIFSALFLKLDVIWSKLFNRNFWI